MSALAPHFISRMQSYSSRTSADGLSEANLHSGGTSTDATSVSSQEEVAHVPENTAIVGMACRLPGAKSPKQLWKNIVEQRDVQRKIPKERFNVDAFYHPEGTNKGTTNARYGYFLDDDVSEFDPEFFQISGKEAEAMDPQQRLLLEVVYEALENAGITLDEISGTETSVFCGSFTNDYREMIHKDLEHYPKYSVTGTGAAILSNRISYFYNLHGPSVTLDTACSSSLVGLHMGNQSIRDGEADISIVVGSALHFDPTIYTTMTDLGFLSVDGRCRAFDAGGSGYVRGEGICAVILKRKSQAEMDGNAIRAIIRGTGCNHDGIKEGITMPNSVAQEALIRRVYKNTGLNTNETQYFEAHGTGTQAGDPRETRAIGAVFAPNRPANKPLYVGSVKTNIGHLEGASGLAGVIKTVMSLEACKILPNMLFNNPNPKIDFEAWKIAVPTKMIDWEPTNGVRRASVNSFGYGGTNAHIIIEGYNKPAVIEEVVILSPEHEAMVEERPFLLPLTSHTEKAGNLLKSNLSTFIAGENVSAGDAALSLSNPGRSAHQYRSYVIGQDSDTIIEKLSTSTGGTPWTRATKTKPRIGFVFTGQGAQHYHMGRELLEKCPMFKQSIQKCDEILQTLEAPPRWSVLTELMKSKEESLVNGIEFSSSLATAIQLSTIDLLRAWGVEPSAVCGHSAGEIPASYAAGILSFKDALACAYYRGCALSGEPVDKVQIEGAMVAVGMTEPEAILELENYPNVKIAAVNSPTSLTLSGDEPEVIALIKVLEGRKVFARRLAVERAYHSHHIAPYAPELTRLSRNVRPRPATCRMFSSVTARVAEWQKMTGAYYALNLVNQVRFSDALTGILIDENEEQNVDVLIEIGAHPALKGPSRQTIQSLNLDIPYFGTITRGANDFEGMLATVGSLYSMGYPVNLEAVNSDLFLGSDGSVVRAAAGKTVDLPSYSWDHSKYWAETRLVKSYRNRAHRHSILGAPMLGNIEKYPRWRSFLRPRELQWLPHHMIDGKVIFPAAGYLTMAIEAAVRLETCPKSIKAISLRDIAIKSALTVSDSETGTEVLFEMQPVSTSAKRTSDTWYRFIIHSFGENGIVNEHCCGLISVEAGDSAPVETDVPTKSLAELRKRSDRCTTSKVFYEHLWNIGLQYGEDFQLITGNVDSGSGYSMAPISLKPGALMTTDNDHCVVHPSFLDASFHPFFAGIESLLGRPLDGPFVPTFMRGMTVSGAFFDMTQSTAEYSLWATAETKLPGPRVAISDITIRSPDCSKILIDIQGLEATALGSSNADGDRKLFFRTRWQPAFDNLAGTAELPAVNTIAQLMDIYAHQHPDTKILHITSDVTETKELLATLYPQQRRRFQTITPYSGTEEQVADLESLKKVYSTLVEAAEPKEGVYDLVVVSKSTTVDVKSYLNATGTVIVAGAEYDGQGMEVLFKNASFTAYRKSYATQHTDQPLTLVMASNVSENTEALAQLIIDQQTVPVARMNFADMVDNVPATKNVIVLASLDQELFFEDPEHEEVHFEAVRSLFTSEDKNIIWIVRGASHETSNPAQAMILGMCRVARNENEKLKVITLDVHESAQNPEILEQVTTIFESRLTEDEIAARNGTLFIPKIEADDSLNAKLPENSGSDAVMQEFGAGQPLALKIGKVGLLETLAFGIDEDIVDTELAADCIEIEVKASAINFRDVAASIGIIDDYRLGDECAGVVLRIGSAVNPNDFKVGDCVVAFRPGQGAHRSIVREQATLCYNLPESISFSTAAAFTCIMVTAYYAFHDLARVQPGEKVLIHAAAGGVGQMAIQVAQMMGAEVIATCGSQAKRDLLKSTYGLTDDHIFSSRDPSFVKDILNLTDGKGVDVVLNSLAGELLHATWNCVARFGRFIEIGKRDIHENAKIDMEPFRKSVGFASLDLITMYEYNKPLSHRLLNETYKLLEQGKINNPQTVLELPYSEAEKGFRLLQMGKHTGKIVLVPHKDDIVSVSQPSYRKTMLFNAEKTYLLSGGLGGLGRTMAEWMVRKGARQLAFMSRSGDARLEAKATVEWLKARDIKVTIFKVDVANEAAVTAAVDSLGDKLAGIFHAAVVLQDAPLNTMSLDQWKGCVHPKVQGAWNLHRATLHLNLDFFIPFSSVACQVGAMGQTNYAAANTYLDALVRYRRSMGLNASSMNCGMIVGVGLVAENESILSWLIKMGSDGVNEDELLYQIEEAVVGGSAPTQFTARGIDPAATTTGVQTKRKDVYWHQRAFFRNLYSNHDLDGGASASKGGNSLGASLQAAKDVPERAQILTGAFIEKIAAVLGVVAETIQPSNPLSMYGLDSIVAVEFRKWFSKTINVDIALFDILSSKSISALVLKAAGLMAIEATTSETSKSSSEETKSNSAGVSEQISGGEQSSDFDAISIARPANIPMSTFQRRMWYAHNLVEDKSALNISITSHIKGTPDITIFKAALDELKSRNELLRTAYSEGDDFAEQKPIENFDSNLVYRDLSSEVDVDASLESWRASLQGEELDIESGEIMRPGLFKVGDGKFAFVVAFHHISIDRGSSKALFEQFVEIYQAIRLEKDLATVPKPRISYPDFSIWYEDHLQSSPLQSEVDFWKQKLAGIKPTSELLPFAKAARPDTMDRVREEIRSTLPLSMLLRLKRVCARVGTTPFQFMLAAFRAFLYRYTEEEDVTVLVIDGNRPRSDLEDVLGFFVNMIPVRLNKDLNGASFENLLTSTKSATVEAIEHSKIPFDSIVEAVNLPKSHSIFPISQVVVNYQMHGKMPRFTTKDFDIHHVVNHDIPTACELALEALEDPDKGLDLRLEYSSTLYAEADIDRFFDNFSTFITSLIQDHRQPIAQVKMSGPKEIEHLKSNFWNMGFTKNTWNGASVVKKILESANATPNVVAIQTAEYGKLTYEQLVDQAQRISATLQQANIAPGTSVGVLASPGADAVVAMVGALMHGCGYLAMDPEFAAQRLSFMASDSAVKLILVGDDLESLACTVAAKTTSPPQVMPIGVAKSSNEKSRYADHSADAPFYTIYTSGSTGIPKGVVLNQSHTQQMLSTLQKDYSFTSSDKFLHQSSMCFDLSIVQIFSALTAGATICIASTSVRKDPALLAKFIQEAGVTVTYFTPTHFALLIESSASLFNLCSNYRVAFFAGERLPARLVDKFRSLKTPAAIYNTWSPSELVVQTTIHEVAESETGDVNIPIGFPMANCRHYILDNQLNPLPAGMIGEICVGGAQVGACYLNRPEANAASFITDPFCSADDISRGWTRFFRTGDKGRFLPDGKLEFHGRIAGDKQIKLRGFRVDLGEVEHRIYLAASEIPGAKLVDNSMVARTLDGKESYTDERQLVAFIVVKPEMSPKEQVKYISTIHAAIGKDLNAYMLPNGYQFLPELPVTIGRKVDRQNLLSRKLTLVYPSSGSTIPVQDISMGNAQQEVLATIFQLYRDVLRLPKDREIGTSDNFFELGGQSILLLRLQAKLKKQYKKVTPTLPELFKGPTPLAISQKICGLSTTPASGASAITAPKQTINWEAEASLPTDKRYLVRYGASTLSSSDITDVLVTGVESFIGLHVFANMLSSEPTKRFYLLGSEKPIEISNLIADLKHYRLLTGAITEQLLASQITLIQGHLMQTNFGLDKTTFSTLGRTVQTIYHLGGKMSLLKDYSTLRRGNAGATMDLIELASSGLHRTEIHYLSTWSVPHLQSHTSAKRSLPSISTTETSPGHFVPSSDAELFYFKSRWVSEMLLTRAADRGFNVSIIRASAVSGSTATGVPAPDDDFVRKMILDMVTLASVPDLHGAEVDSPKYAIDFIPVNYLASTLQALTTSDFLRDSKTFAKQNLSIYHIGNPSPMLLHDLPTLIPQLRIDGKGCKLVSLQDWLAEMKAKAKSEGDVLRWEAVKNVCETGHVMFSLDQRQTLEALEEVDSSLSCPPMDVSFLKMLGA